MHPYPKIHGICLVKNEADVVELCLTEASKWCDSIYVYDNGSTDGTWDIVRSLRSETIIPWKRDERVFSRSMRGDVFNHFKTRANQGDWWCTLDADEFYIDDPRRFLAPIPSPYHSVWGAAVEYYITTSDLDNIDFAAPARDVLPQLKYYRATNSEPRFFRHRRRLQWRDSDGSPMHMGLTHRARIRYRHYKYRSPQQIKLRLKTRLDSVANGAAAWWGKTSANWLDHVADPATCLREDPDRPLVLNEDTLPDHLGPPSHRALKWLMHRTHLWP